MMRLLPALAALLLSSTALALSDTGPSWLDSASIKISNGKLYLRTGEPYTVQRGVVSGLRPLYAVPDKKGDTLRKIGTVAIGTACKITAPVTAPDGYRAATNAAGQSGIALCNGSLHCAWARIDRVSDLLALIPPSDKWYSVTAAWSIIPHVPLDDADEKECAAP